MEIKLKNKLICILILVQCCLLSCSGFSKTGRNFVIQKARAEASKKEKSPIPETIKKNTVPKTEPIENIVNPEESKKIKKILDYNEIPPVQGELIQVEGLVLREVTILLSDLEASDDRFDQIIKMKNHVYKNWRYIYDPATKSDTWRSAEATISLKYKGKYSGDCDDYAILLASFGKQIGLKTRLIGGYHNNLGHAFAEFEVNQDDLKSSHLQDIDYREVNGSYWVSLDWFKGENHNKYTNNTKVLIEYNEM